MTNGTTTTKYFYIGSPTGVAGIYVLGASGSGILHFTFNDHLGSLTEIVNSSTNEVTIQRFDAWGNPRFPEDWRYPSDVSLFADRGFSGHEHLEKFALINMNGRMYDPGLGRFLSPDPYVQIPDFSQNFNRYSYCLNNPLIYSDPNGESIVAIMMLGAFINTMMQDMAGNIHNVGDFFMTAGVGALSSAAGGLAGQAVSKAIQTGGFLGGAITGGAGGAIGGFIGSSGNAWINGASFNEGLGSGLKGGGTGALSGAIVGGLIKGFSDHKAGYSFWDGTKVDEMNIGLGVNEQLAKNYSNSKLADTYDDALKEKIAKNFKGIAEGDYGIKDITTKTSSGYGMTTEGKYINLRTRQGVSGYCVSSRAGGWSKLHISNYILGSNDVTFNAVVGHEIIHSFHYYTIPYVSTILTEKVAYKYTYDVYMNNRFYNAASSIKQTGIANLFWGSITPKYSLPLEVLQYLP